MLLLRGATVGSDCVLLFVRVSIHAPLARSNKDTQILVFRSERFNTCSSCEEQPAGGSVAKRVSKFQYMLLLRGATKPVAPHKRKTEFQYMLLLRGATQRFCTAGLRGVVSIHAPLARSNIISRHVIILEKPFQYMLLLRGATGSSDKEVNSSGFQYMLLLRGATQLCTF